jgi:hypothetical protein
MTLEFSIVLCINVMVFWAVMSCGLAGGASVLEESFLLSGTQRQQIPLKNSMQYGKLHNITTLDPRSHKSSFNDFIHAQNLPDSL